MNIETADVYQEEKSERFPNSVMAKKDKFYKEHGDVIDALILKLLAGMILQQV